MSDGYESFAAGEFGEDGTAVGLGEDIEEGIDDSGSDDSGINLACECLIDFEDAFEFFFGFGLEGAEPGGHGATHDGVGDTIDDVDSRGGFEEGLFGVVVDFEAELDGAEFDAVAVFERGGVFLSACNLLPVQERAVGTFEILNEVLVPFFDDLGVIAGDGADGGIHLNLTIGMSADFGGELFELVGDGLFIGEQDDSDHWCLADPAAGRQMERVPWESRSGGVAVF